MIWVFDSSESTYTAKFPQSRVSITVEGDEWGEADAAGEFLPLKEGRFYHFELTDRKAKLSQKSSFIHKPASHGSIAPGTAVGYGRIYLEGAESPELSLGVEVASEVISYKKDYQELLQQLTEDIADLQMQCTSNVQGMVGVNERTGGAYVLYPGTKKRIDRENGEILPGLGAFTLSPSNDSSTEIRGFLSSVARHLCDRVTRWENYTYRAFQIYKQEKDAFIASQKHVETLMIPDYDEVEMRNGHRVNLDDATAQRYLDPDRYISVELKAAEKSLKWAYENNLFILQKSNWDKLKKPAPERITLISVAWHPPINLLVQRFVESMQARMVKGRYPNCPFVFDTEAKLDEEYLVWEVRAIDTKTLETRLSKRI